MHILACGHEVHNFGKSRCVAIGEWEIDEDGCKPVVVYRTVCSNCYELYKSDIEWNLLPSDEEEMEWLNQ